MSIRSASSLVCSVSCVFCSSSCLICSFCVLGDRLPVDPRLGQLLAVLSVRLGEHLVALGLPGLREQDQRRGVGGLGREREVEEDERVRVEVDEDRVGVERDPGDDDEGLGEDVLRRAEEARQPLGVLAEPVVAEGRAQARVRAQEAERLLHQAERLLNGAPDRPGHGLTVLARPASPPRREAPRRARRDPVRRCSPGTTRAGAGGRASAGPAPPRGAGRRASSSGGS